ncbi:MAG: iron ABC transporter permease [Azovibrio sp.]|nr:iron ABC transporter permease [Azovibrio sp.]
MSRRLSLLPLRLLTLLGTMLASLSLGRYPLPPGEVLHFLLHQLGLGELEAQRQALLHNLIVDIRLPRVLTAVLVGAALSISGAAYQAVFRNPLVSPGLLGVLPGAAAGAALGLVFSDSWWIMQVAAFATGFLAVAIGVGIAGLFGGSLVMLVLGGIISGALFTALLSLVKYVADPYNQLPAIVYWLMGSLATADLPDLARVAIPMGLGILLLASLGRALDALSMGDDEAATLGLPIRSVRYGVIALATLISALTVSLAGVIGWVGLLVPHIARLITGPGNRLLLPASALLGAIFLLLADGLARNLAETEIPIGIVTELLGIPAFLLVLHRARKGWV